VVALLTMQQLAPGVLEGSFSGYAMVLVPTFFASACAGLLVSSLLRSAEGVIVLAVFYAIVQVAFSVFAPLHVVHGEDKRGGWLSLASAPITARWSLAGLVGHSDLCTQDGVAETRPQTTVVAQVGQVVQVAEAAFFKQNCARDFYQDHGVNPAETRAQRTDVRHANRSAVANGVLALIALIGTGLSLWRQERQ
jgi:hypothetical protein